MQDDCGQGSPITANIKTLGYVFNDADVAPNTTKERLALFDCDPDGEIEVDTHGNNTFYLMEGYVYQSGHGRDKCTTTTCLDGGADVPNNCGHHKQFVLPAQYKPCGSNCRGGYCGCLRSYADYT